MDTELKTPRQPSRREALAVGVAAASSLLAASSLKAADNPTTSKKALTLVVMDPMAGPLACDCVQGYAQRKYEKLGSYLEEKLKVPVTVAWSESLVTAVNEKTDGKADIIVGKDSVVLSDAKRAKLSVRPVASLTDKQGSTKQKGLFVVRSESKAASLIDVDGYTMLFGPDNCDEKWAAPRAKLKELELGFSEASKSCDSCSVAAKELMTLPSDAKSVAIISSYAAPLLEGCGTIKKGDLKIIGESDEVPFVTCFINEALASDVQDAIRRSLEEMKSPEMLEALETKNGFVTYSPTKLSVK